MNWSSPDAGINGPFFVALPWVQQVGLQVVHKDFVSVNEAAGVVVAQKFLRLSLGFNDLVAGCRDGLRGRGCMPFAYHLIPYLSYTLSFISPVCISLCLLSFQTPSPYTL